VAVLTEPIRTNKCSLNEYFFILFAPAKRVFGVTASSDLAPNGGSEGNGAAAGTERALTAVLEAGLSVPGAAQTAAQFLPALTGPARGVQAVLLYGSVLWNSLRGATSQPDFIVVVDSSRGWNRRLLDRLWGAVLPPSVYCLRMGGGQAKVSVVTARELISQTGADTRDLHLAGRLSKRVALVWWRDSAARQRIIDAQRSALETMARLTLSRFDGPIELDGFLRALLGLSYESEVRIVEPGKVAALFDVERDHYRTVGRALLAALGAAPLDPAGTRFRLPAGVSAAPAETRRRLRRSRRRAYLRWPKYLATYDGWLDYLLQKLARSGHQVSLTDRQRRHPLIFALPVLCQMVRARRVG
jgi:hypothetical protein